MKKNEAVEAAKRLSEKQREALTYISKTSPTIDEVRASTVDGRTLSPLVKKNLVVVKAGRYKTTPDGTKVIQAATPIA